MSEELEETKEFEEVEPNLQTEEELLDEKYAKRREILRKNKKMKRLAESLSLTIADIEYALRRHRGVTFYAAQYLGTTRAILHKKIQMTPSLKRLQLELLEEYKDIAEAKLLAQVEEGMFQAVSFYLRTQGKDRGYTEKGTIEHGVDTESFRNAATLINAMRRGAEQAHELEVQKKLDEIAPVIEDRDAEYTWVELPESTESLPPES